MGEVYKAEYTKLDRPVALKFLPQSLTPTEEDGQWLNHYQYHLTEHEFKKS